MTYDEARAMFPVLERLAYLNAGTFGPLSRGVMGAVEAEQRRELEEGRIGGEYFERVLPMLVDGAQSVGAIPVDATGLDFLTIPGQKWVCGPDATGALVVADPERLQIGRPGYFAQVSHEPDGSFVVRDGAERFDPNWIPAASIAALEVA